MKVDIIITRINNFEYSFIGSTHIGIRHIAHALTYDNPDEYAYKPKQEMFDKRKYTFKIGMLYDLLAYIKEHKVSYFLKDDEHTIPGQWKFDERMSGKYSYQKDSISAFFKRRFGIIKVPTRGGKTFIASEIIRVFLESDTGNFLFVVDTMDLFNQAVGDIKEFFAPYYNIDIGRIEAGKVDVSKRVTVAMIQTIQSTLSRRCSDRKKKAGLDKYLKELKFLCVDEIHDNCSDSRLKIYKKSKKLEYQLCLSATPYRSETWLQNLKLQSWSGDIVYDISENLLRKKKVLSDYKVFMLLFDHNEIDFLKLGEQGVDYNEYRKRIIFENKYRNGALIRVLFLLKKLGLKTLVIFQSVDHGQLISKRTGYKFISGVTTTDKRAEIKDEFLSDTGKILLTSNIFKKGITLPSVEVLINVDGGLEDANTIQKKGRVLGTTDIKNRSLIIDFFDVYDLYFSDHSETRLNTYINSIGEKNVGILDTSVDDCYETLERWIRKWFLKEETNSSSSQ